jgi:CHAT domain-containing protein/Tfp pilus assembly protein PilF
MTGTRERNVLVLSVLLASAVVRADDSADERKRLLDRAAKVNQQAVSLYQRGQYSQATRLLREGLRILEKAYPKEQYPNGHADLANNLGNLGSLLQAQGELNEALGFLQRGLAMNERLYAKEKFPNGHEDLATSLSNLGTLHQARGEYDRAIDYHRRALAMRERLYPKEKYPQGHLDLATSLNNLGFLHQGKGENGAAQDCFERALVMMERLFPKDKHPNGHVYLAAALDNLGYQLQLGGELDKALDYHRRALAMREVLFPKAKFPSGHPHLAASLNNVGLVLRLQDDFGGALEFYGRALRIYEALFPKDKYPRGHPHLATCLDNLGLLHRARGEYDKALDCHRRALAMREQLYPRRAFPKGHAQLAISFDNLGLLDKARGKLGSALAHFQRALEMRQALYPKDKYPNGHPELSVNLNNLGTLLHEQGEFAKALDCYLRSVAMDERLYPKDKFPNGHHHLASSLGNASLLLQDRGEYSQALQYLNRQLEVLEALYPRDKYPNSHPQVAVSFNNLASMLQAREKYDQALESYRLALAVYKRLYPQDKFPHGHPHLAFVLDNLGSLYRLMGKYDQGIDFCRRALAMREKLYPKEKYPNGHADLVSNLRNLGVLHLAAGENGPALDFFRRGLAMQEELSQTFLSTASEAEALNYLAKRSSVFDGYLTATRNQSEEDAGYAHVWRGKATLAKLLERRRQSLRLAEPAVREWGNELASTRQQLATLLLAPAGHFKDQVDRLKALTDRKEELERQIARQLPAFAESQARDRLTHRDLLAHLPPRTAFVDLLRCTYREHDPKQPGKKGEKFVSSYVAFVLRAGKPVRRVELGEAEPIDRAVRQWRNDLAAWKSGRREVQDAAVLLSQRLWKPLAKHVPADTETVFLAPDGALTSLPWAALPGRKKDTVLLEDHALAVVPHGRMLVEQLLTKPTAERERGTLLAVGAVRYDREAAPLASSTESTQKRDATLGPKRLHWSYLPATEKELSQVRTLAGKRRMRVRQGNEASPGALLQDLPEARWAHLATHGFFADTQFRSVLQVEEKDFARRLYISGEVFDRIGAGARNPLVLSGLVLSGANLDEKAGGILSAEAIAGLSLHKLELAVLSACETGLGEVAGGEGVFGLQRAFHVAGTRTVIASLWKVDDQATAALMSLFYHKLWRDRKTPLTALREAQLELFRNPERIAELAKLRGPDLEREVSRPVEKPEPAAKGERAAVKLWAGFTLSGLGR